VLYTKLQALRQPDALADQRNVSVLVPEYREHNPRNLPRITEGKVVAQAISMLVPIYWKEFGLSKVYLALKHDCGISSVCDRGCNALVRFRISEELNERTKRTH
jgi:hypothetical protein